MGEEDMKKQEEKKGEEAGKKQEGEKKEEGEDEKPAAEDKKAEESKGGGAEESKDPPPPPEIVLKVYMHCEGCARKVRRCLKGFQGVEEVQTDCKSHTVVVKGEKADPLKVLERIQRKSHRKVELLSPIPPPLPEEPKNAEQIEAPKSEDKKEEPLVITVVLKVYMHCEACAQEIKKRIKKMKGVDNVDSDLKSSQVTVKGVFEPPKVVEYVYKRTGKHAVIVKVEPEKKEEDKGKEDKEEKKAAEESKEEGKKAEEESKEKEGGSGGGGGGAAAGGGGEVPAAKVEEAEEEGSKIELKKNEFYHLYPQYYYQVYPQRFGQEMYSYPPQIFSDENPNACSIM